MSGDIDQEIVLAAQLGVIIDALTRLGPRPTARVLTWVFARYGIEETIYSSQVRDRRPPKMAPLPATTETTRLEPPAEATPRPRRRGRPKKEPS